MTNRPVGFRPIRTIEPKSIRSIIGTIISQMSTAIGALIWLPEPNSRPRIVATRPGRETTEGHPGYHAESHPEAEVTVEDAQPLPCRRSGSRGNRQIQNVVVHEVISRAIK